MPKFLVTYLAPSSVIEDWKKTDPEKRKVAEEKMRGDWIKRMTDHAKSLADKGAGVGKTKRVTSDGISDTKNEIMLYSVVEADSHQIQSSKPIRTRLLRKCSKSIRTW